MIKALRWAADKLSNLKCYIHIKWNSLLDRLKTECTCEKSQK